MDPIACGYAEANARAAGRAGLVDVRNVAMGDLAPGEPVPGDRGGPAVGAQRAGGVLPRRPGPRDRRRVGRPRAGPRVCGRHRPPPRPPRCGPAAGSARWTRRGACGRSLPDSLRMSDVRAEPGCGLVLLLQRPEGLS
ncbi:hypothetical protein G5V59_25355 [Nocardioides sp. W3-2-3]|uniref:hypothetical protein n=1 Tax=Nocardioides convexus TaxID=2712224 RepID=UPI002418304C|nr:hypothetical protein [Nocardioides convexus]NHA01854.1 hypothetical protein [Nocardioides convexus]